MKKVLKILLIFVIATITALTMVACTPAQDPTNKTGLLYKKDRDGVFVVYDYKDDGSKQEIVTVEIPQAETIRIDKGAFSGNDTIKKLVVSSAVKEITAGAFENMLALQTLEVPFIGQFANADATFVESGSANDGEKATGKARTISHFFGTSEYDKGSVMTIKHLESGSEVETICYVPAALEKIVINAADGYSIPMDAFNGFIGGAQTLAIEINGNVKAIGERAFKGTSISSIVLPASVKTIYDGAFNNCKLLSKVEFASGAAEIEVKADAFKGCEMMNKLDASDNLTVNFAKFSLVEAGAFDFGNTKTYTVLSSAGFNLSVIFGSTNAQ